MILMTEFSARMRALLTVVALLVAASGLADPLSLKRALENLLNHQPAATLGIHSDRMNPAQMDESLLKSYQKQGMQPIWVTPEGPGKRAAILYETLKAASAEGLRSEDYRVGEIESLWSQRTDPQLAKLDIVLSVVLSTYVADVRDGRAASRKLDAEPFTVGDNPAPDPATLAVEAANSEDFQKFLADQPPGHAQYQRLKKALSDYRTLAANGEWEPVREGSTLKPGMKNDRILKIRAHLKRSGDLAADSPDSPIYDVALVAAVKQFQKRFLLQSDGAIGKKTVAAMNIPISELIRRIVINMERWRWLSHDLGDKRLFVNIAGFYLQGSRDNQIDLSMP
ncbi:MAG: peptidoglycan-binding protein, partial [Methylococcales bacterium]